MNFTVKLIILERLAFISLGVGREALKSGKLHLWKWNLYTAQASTLGVFIFSFGTLQALGFRLTPQSLEEDAAFFYNAKRR